MSYRFFNPAPVFADLLGIKPLAGGSLAFYDLGTTTPKLTWSDAELTVPNPNPVPLDSSGRANVNIFLDGGYSVRLLDAYGATVWTRDVNDGGGAGATIPSLMAGQFLTNDGSTLQWGDVRQVPDPSGSSGNILSTDGSNLVWIPQPTIPEPEPESKVQAAASGYLWINGILQQWGTGSAPASGVKSTSSAVTMPITFDEVAYHVDVSANIGTITQNGSNVATTLTNRGANTFTAIFGLADDDNKSWKAINVAIPFTWFAVGKKAVAP